MTIQVRTENLCTLVATPGQGACKHGIWKDSVVQATISEHAIIGAESACQGRVHYVPHTTMSGALDCPLGLVERDTPMLGKYIGVNNKLPLQGSEMGSLHCSGHVNQHADVGLQQSSHCL